MVRSAYAALSREQLAGLVPELLLAGQLIDRSGMAWCISAHGREEMARIAIEEWMGASPIYTERMQRALGFEGDDVVTVFKGLQLDIGAPPQFMDFRYTVHDRWSGEFHLDHCGALMDVEPMGEDYVRSMCHDIEDPTFDATAVATNPRAQVRPLHRPPRAPADRHPHCAWTVRISPDHAPVEESAGCTQLRESAAAHVLLDDIDALDPGAADYSGALMSDVDFAGFSHSALVRIADEVALQSQLLNLSFVMAVGARGDDGTIAERQLVGWAGVTAERLHRFLGSPRGVAGAVAVAEVHPLLNPAAYVRPAPRPAGSSPYSFGVALSPAHSDDGWQRHLGPHSIRPLQAIVRAVDPRLDVEVEGSATDWVARVVETDSEAPPFDEVAVSRFSTGATFDIGERRSLPVFVV